MNIELLSLITGLVVFFIIISFNQEKKDLDSDILLRLDNIKNKVFDGQETKEKKPTEAKADQKIKIFIQDTEYKIKLLGNILDKLKFASKVKEMLRVADLRVEVDVFLLFSVGLALPFLLLILVIPSRALPFIVLSLILGSLPYVIVKIKIKKRLELFTQQFPDALGLIASSLRAGHALTSAFKMVVEEMPEPVNQVFKVVVDDITLGRDTRESLENMSKFMPGSVDLRFFITAILIQREIGGNLPEIADKLSYTLRERFKLLGQLNAQTAQARLSGYVLAFAPVFIGGVIWMINPGYMKPLFNSIIGQYALGIALVNLIIGFLTIKQITNIRV